MVNIYKVRVAQAGKKMKDLADEISKLGAISPKPWELSRALDPQNNQSAKNQMIRDEAEKVLKRWEGK